MIEPRFFFAKSWGITVDQQINPDNPFFYFLENKYFIKITVDLRWSLNIEEGLGKNSPVRRHQLGLYSSFIGLFKNVAPFSGAWI